MKYQIILRSRGANATIVAAGIAVFLLWALVLRTDGWIELLRVVPLGVTAFFIVWWWRYWPYLQLSEEGVLIGNPLVSVALPWKAVKEGLSHLGLYVIDKDGKKWYVSAIPATSSFSGKRKEPTMPDLQTGQTPIRKITAEPMIAARIIDEEVYYQKNPELRPRDFGGVTVGDDSILAWPTWTQSSSSKESGVIRHYNWLWICVGIGLLAVTVLSLASASW